MTDRTYPQVTVRLPAPRVAPITVLFATAAMILLLVSIPYGYNAGTYGHGNVAEPVTAISVGVLALIAATVSHHKSQQAARQHARGLLCAALANAWGLRPAPGQEHLLPLPARTDPVLPFPDPTVLFHDTTGAEHTLQVSALPWEGHRTVTLTGKPGPTVPTTGLGPDSPAKPTVWVPSRAVAAVRSHELTRTVVWVAVTGGVFAAMSYLPWWIMPVVLAVAAAVAVAGGCWSAGVAQRTIDKARDRDQVAVTDAVREATGVAVEGPVPVLETDGRSPLVLPCVAPDGTPGWVAVHVRPDVGRARLGVTIYPLVGVKRDVPSQVMWAAPAMGDAGFGGVADWLATQPTTLDE